MKRNFLSVHDITKKWGHVTFYPRRAAIYNTRHPYPPRCIGTAILQQGMYFLDKPIQKFPVRAVIFATRKAPTLRRARGRKQKTAEAVWVEKTRSPNSGPDRIIKKTSSTVMMPKREQKLHMNAMRNPTPPAPTPSNRENVYHDYHLIFNHTQPRTQHKMATEHLMPHLPRRLRQNLPNSLAPAARMRSNELNHTTAK